MFGQTTKLYWASLAERIRRFLAAVKQLTIAKLTIAFILSLMLVWTAPPRAQLLISGLPAPTPSSSQQVASALFHVEHLPPMRSGRVSELIVGYQAILPTDASLPILRAEPSVEGSRQSRNLETEKFALGV